jgi:hypothetical protein
LLGRSDENYGHSPSGDHKKVSELRVVAGEGKSIHHECFSVLMPVKVSNFFIDVEMCNGRHVLQVFENGPEHVQSTDNASVLRHLKALNSPLGMLLPPAFE